MSAKVSQNSQQSFAESISKARKALRMSQKDLAALVKKEDGFPITPQYLNDIEHGRRNPPSEAMIIQLADALKIPSEALLAIAGVMPDDLRAKASSASPAVVEEAFRLFRKTLTKG